jgi:chitodextrinase
LPSSPPNTEGDAVLYAWNNGVVVVAGAGNNGDTSKFYPAACTDDLATGGGQSTVIAVAASNDRDNRPGFSTYSTDADDWVSIAAPGEAILGILPDYHCSLPSGSDSCVNWWDGTSMAAPLVAGGAALVWEDVYQQPGFNGVYAPAGCTVDGAPCNQVVRQRLEDGADKIGAEGQDLLQWTRHGRLNIAGALAAPGVVTYTLTVTKTGGGAGTVSSLEGGIICGNNCTETYPEGTLVTLTADPAPGSSFFGWGGDCDAFATVTMDADKTCEAEFVQDSGNDAPPRAVFKYVCKGLVCDFDGSASSDDQGILSFMWDFGDGQTANGSHTQHIYSLAGRYTVMLTVTDTVSQQNTVTAPVSPKVKGKTKGGSGTRKPNPRGQRH